MKKQTRTKNKFHCNRCDNPFFSYQSAPRYCGLCKSALWKTPRTYIVLGGDAEPKRKRRKLTGKAAAKYKADPMNQFYDERGRLYGIREEKMRILESLEDEYQTARRAGKFSGNLNEQYEANLINAIEFAREHLERAKQAIETHNSNIPSPLNKK